MIVIGGSSVADPAGKPLTDRGKISLVGLAGCEVGEGFEKIRFRGDEPVPHIENLFDLTMQNLTRFAQPLRIFRGEEHAFLESCELAEGQG